MDSNKIIQAVFYRTAAAGNEPVREWLKSLPVEERKLIGEDIKAVEMKWPQGLPQVRKMEPDLWEVRTVLPQRKSRVLFTVWGSFLVLLHGFIKKDQKTPKEDLSLAKKRRDDVFRGGIRHE
jgi:phage-related protein